MKQLKQTLNAFWNGIVDLIITILEDVIPWVFKGGAIVGIFVAFTQHTIGDAILYFLLWLAIGFGLALFLERIMLILESTTSEIK